ncbi:MAG: hypothetical protein AAFP02_04775 [Bacteroidota bacterium]
MQQISLDQVDATYDWISSMEDETEIEGLVIAFSEAQPILFAYVMTMGEVDFDQDENELLLFLGLVIWQTYLRSGRKLVAVEEAQIEAVQAENASMLEYLADENESGFEQVARNLMQEGAHPQLLAFLVEIIFEDEEDIIRPHNQGIMFIFLKVIIDAIESSFS